MHTEKRQFLRYVATYVIVLLIPILAFLILFRFSFLDRVYKQAEERLDLIVGEVVRELAAELDQLSDISYRIERSSDFLSVRIRDPLTAIGAQNTLSTLNISNDLVEEIAYFPSNVDIVYTSRSPYKPETYFFDVLRLSRAGSQKLVDLMNTVTDSILALFERSTGEKSQLLLIDTIPILGEYQKGVLVYSFSAGAIEGMMARALIEGSAKAALLSDGEFLLSVTRGSVDERTAMLKKLVPIPGQNLTFVLEVERRALFAAANRSIVLLTILVIAVLLTSLPLVYLFSNASYSPIRRIQQFLDATFRGDSEPADISRTVEDHILGLIDERDDLSDRLFRSSDLVRRELILKLLKGSVRQEERARALFTDYGIDLQGDSFRVIVLAFEEKLMEQDLLSISDALKLVGDSVRSFCIQEFDTGQVVSVLCGFKPALEEVNSELSRIRTVHPWLSVHIFGAGVGRVVSTLGQISQSYVEAKSAIEHRFVLGIDKIIAFEDFGQKDESGYEYPVKDIARIESLVRKSDTARVSESVTSLIDGVKRHAPPLFAARCILYDVVTTLVKTTAETVPHKQSEAWRLADALRVAQAQTIDQLGIILGELCREICCILEDENKREDDEAFSRVLELIHERAFDPSFSAAMVADVCGMSLSNFSHQFKHHIGITFRDYLNRIRMKEARRLLRATDIPLTAVVATIGYSDSNSFIKKFKREYGMTPIAYRRKEQLKQATASIST